MRWLKNQADFLTKPSGLSLITVVLFASWAWQMGTWGWGTRWNDWRSWVGYLGGWAGANVVQVLVNEARGWVAARARRKAVQP